LSCGNTVRFLRKASIPHSCNSIPISILDWGFWILDCSVY
jgi:hypothetical protein